MDDAFKHGGVLLVAHTSHAYVAEAIAMAWSIRQNSPGIPIALATDISDYKLPEELFDKTVIYNFTGKSGVSFKIWLDEISPWERTLFLDSDAFVYKSLKPVFHRFAQQPFIALGKSIPKVGHWFKDPERILKEFSMPSMSLVIGDFYLFDRSPASCRVFKKARELFDRYDELGIERLHGGFNEEPLFSLAMHIEGIECGKRSPDLVLALEYAKAFSDLQTNVLKSEARVQIGGETIAPCVVHYGSYRSQPVYFQDRVRVEGVLAGRTARSDRLNALEARFQSFRFRVSRKFRKFL